MDAAEFRLKHLSDPRAAAVIRAAMKLSGWQSRPSASERTSGSIAKGRGISYTRYNGTITYVAAVADVEVNRDTGEVRVTRICMGHDCGQMINPDGVANQVEGGVLQTVSRTLMEEVKWDRTKVTSVDWASYPILRFPEAPRVDIALIDRPGEVSWGVGEPSAVVIPAAIGNAVFDAVGARLRTVPFTPARVKEALKEAEAKRA
jgi:nicotinate dehydrogenase subunit B